MPHSSPDNTKTEEFAIMAQQTQPIEFHFVNSSISSPSVPKDHAVRTLIRKQAMKKASAARRRDGSYGKHNLRQYPVFLVDEKKVGDGWVAPTPKQQQGDHGDSLVHIEEINTPQLTNSTTPESSDSDHSREYTTRPESSSRIVVERQRFQRRLVLAENVPRNLSAKGYELTSMKNDFDIRDLSTLATLYVGRVVRAVLSQNPYNLVHQLRTHQRWSYLTFLPSRWEHTPCLRDAANCVIARARQVIHPTENWEASVIPFYLKALNSLQNALDCPKERFQPEVLCAIEILAMYELMDPSGEKAWIRHAAGAAKLIQLRGPKSYNTEFEKALFIAQTFPITTECLLNGERCFLEQKAWQKVLRSVIKETPDNAFSDRSEIVVTLLMYKSFIPTLAIDVFNIICGDAVPEAQFIENVINRLRQTRTSFKSWRERYDVILSNCTDLYPGSANHDSHCRIFANFAACLIITSRLLVAISPSDRVEAEWTAQQLANEMVDLENEVKGSPASLFMAMTVYIAQATKATSEEWRPKSVTEDENYTSSNGLQDRRKLERWAGMFGRKRSR